MAGPFTWTFDSPTGTYKNFNLSRRLYEAAIAECVFMDYARTVEGFGLKSGESATMTRVSALAEPADPTLVETAPIPEDLLKLSTVSIVVKEFGRAVPYTELSDDLSKYDLENPIQSVLKDQMKLSLDTACAKAFLLAKPCYTPTGTAGAPTSAIVTTGTPAVAATRNLQVYDLEELRDYMYDTLLIPHYSGEEYIGIFRARALLGVRRDPNWIPWHQYTNPSAKFNAETGMIEQIRLIETNHAQALPMVGTGGVLGSGVVFGKEPVAMAEANTPELRAKIPDDYGRFKGVAWYGTLGFGLIWDTANPGETRIVRVTSA
jgi:N4-gp56 family major capsid protein